MPKHKVGIIGATGYTGAELVRILTYHPQVEIEIVTSESKAGTKFSAIHPQFLRLADMTLQSAQDIKNTHLDIIFLALPHGVSMDFVKDYGYEQARIIDLSGDFRLTCPALYEKWYHKRHTLPQALKDAVFGLPELYRHPLRMANLVANPGCYPTSALLPLAPLLKSGLIEEKGIIIDSKSGVTGAGAKANENTHFPAVFGNFSAYGLKNHRHSPEIQRTLANYVSKEVEILFTPHLLPIDRGILTTTYSKPKGKISEAALVDIYAVYEKEFFVRLVNQPPAVKNVRGSNFCDIYITYDDRTNTVITISAIDNLVKGAAGQAVQNMNIMLGFLEKTGLEAMPLCP